MCNLKHQTNEKWAKNMNSRLWEKSKIIFATQFMIKFQSKKKFFEEKNEALSLKERNSLKRRFL
jgi:hypothetical protein